MKLIYSDKYVVNLKGHIFPVEKYRLIKEKLLKEKIVNLENFLVPKPASDEDVLLVHTEEYIRKLKTSSLSLNEIFTLELPFSSELVEASFLCAGGSILASQKALEEGLGINLGGGFHHAFPDHGEGFCVLNDISIAIKKLQKERKVIKILIIDCDLHQGNGTSFIFKNDPSVFTFSIHQENNYPYPKQTSDLDIGLSNNVSDKEYLFYLKKYIPCIIKNFKPGLIVYLAGADPYFQDQLGGLGLTKKGLQERDQLIISEAYNNKIPFFITLAGGYAKKLEDTVEIHFNTIKATTIFKDFVF